MTTSPPHVSSPSHGTLALVAAVALALPMLTSRVARADGESPTVLILETRGPAVSSVATAAVTRQLFATVARLGYRTVEEAAAAPAPGAQPPEPTPAELLDGTRRARAAHGLSTTLSAADARYQLRLVLANADRTGPFIAADSADATTLEATADRLVRGLLPPARTDEPTPASERAHARLAVQTEGALGLTRPFFYNHLLGARLDYVFPGNFALGGYLGYANLRGKEGRASNVLPYLQLEYAPGLGRSPRAVSLPLRFGTGYLPRNGPFMRFAVGPSVPVSDTLRLGFDLIAPTFWVVGNRPVVSMDVGAELSFDL